MTLNNVILFSMLLLPLFLVHVTALKCYRCNSNDNADCFNVRPLARANGTTAPKLSTNITTTTTERSAGLTTTTTTTTATQVASNSSKQPKEALPSFLEECPPDDKGRQPFCRKMVYTILNNKHHRVVRECGYERSERDCYMADNDDHLEMVCQCWTDGCNGAERVTFGSMVALTLLGGFVLRMLISY